MSTAIELESERKAADGGLAGRANGQHVEQIESAAEEDGVHGGQLSADELAIEKKLLRKIDARIMPVVITIYLMNYIDRFVLCALLPFIEAVQALTKIWDGCRNNYAAARLQGLEADLGLTEAQYQTGLSILFVGTSR
jgi:hypothetical protein